MTASYVTATQDDTADHPEWSNFSMPVATASASESFDEVIRRATAEVVEALEAGSLEFGCLPPLGFAASVTTRHTRASVSQWNRATGSKVSYKRLMPRQVADLLMCYREIAVVPAHDGVEGHEARDMALIAIYDEEQGLYVECSGKANLLTGLVRELIYDADESIFKEVMSVIKDLAPIRYQCTDPDLVALEDCIYNMRTDERVPYSPDYVFLGKALTRLPESEPELPRIQNPDGTWWDPRSWLLETLGSHELVRCVLEGINYTLRPRSFSDDKLVVYYADSGSNGKGTLLELNRAIIGGPKGLRCTSLGLEKFSGANTFALTSLLRASANLSDESDPDAFMSSSATLKAVTSHDPVQIERKFRDPVEVKLFVPMIFSLNRLPRIKDKTAAMERRLHVIPFGQRFMTDGSTEVKRNSLIKSDYVKRPEVREWFVWQALKVIGPITSLSVPPEVADAVDMYREENDPVVSFWHRWGPEFTSSDLNMVPLSMSYDLYVAESRALRPGAPIESERVFSDRLVAEVTRKGGGCGWRIELDGNGDRRKYSLKSWSLEYADVCRELFGHLALSVLNSREVGMGQQVHEEVVTGHIGLARWTREVLPAGTRVRTSPIPSRGRCLVRDRDAAAAETTAAETTAAETTVAESAEVIQARREALYTHVAEHGAGRYRYELIKDLGRDDGYVPERLRLRGSAAATFVDAAIAHWVETGEATLQGDYVRWRAWSPTEPGDPSTDPRPRASTPSIELLDRINGLPPVESDEVVRERRNALLTVVAEQGSRGQYQRELVKAMEEQVPEHLRLYGEQAERFINTTVRYWRDTGQATVVDNRVLWLDFKDIGPIPTGNPASPATAASEGS